MSVVLDSIGRDLRYALRGLLRRPAFTLAAVLTLAIGIGATTAIFSVVYSVLLKPLPYPDSDQLVRIRHPAAALNSADLNGQFFNALDGVSMVLKEYDKTVIEVAGHTDSSGSDQYNQALSERRAQAVAGYLASHGVKNQRLITIGAGEGHPVASNDTEQGRAANRRVELTIVPVTKQG